MSTIKKIDAGSDNACHSGLNIFNVPPTNASIVKSTLREILPLNAIDDPNTERYEFRIFSDNQWLDLSRTYLYLQLQLQKKVGANWVNIDADTDKPVAACQTLGQSFIKQLRVSIAGTEVYDSTQLYPYLCYMKNELNYSADMKDTVLAAAGYARDTAKNDPESPGFKHRVSTIGQGAPVEYMARLEFDLANQSQFLINNVDVNFTMTKMDDAFLVHTLKAGDTNKYRIRALNVRMYVMAVDIQPSLNLAIAQTLEKQPAKYTIRQTAIRSNYISAGRSEFVHNVFTNIIPRCAIIGLCDGEAHDGDQTLDPFNFGHHNVREITINAGGLNYPSVAYNFAWNKDKPPVTFMRGYLDMMNASMSQRNLTNGITIYQYINGWTFFVIPLTPSLDDCGGVEPVRNGTTTVHIKFNEKLQKGINIIYIGEFDQILTIDNARQVISDTSAITL